jgi:hypothetical protein
VGEAGAAREPRFALAAHGVSASVEHEGWLFVLNLRPFLAQSAPQPVPTGAAELYHLTADPRAEDDLLTQELPRAKRLRALLLRWLASASEAPHVASAESAGSADVGEARARALVELGYAGSAREGASVLWDPEATDPEWAGSPWRRLFEESGYPLEAFLHATAR